MTDTLLTPPAVAPTVAETPAAPLRPAAPTAPAGLGEQLPSAVREGLHDLLWSCGGQLESVYRARVLHPAAITPTMLYHHTVCSSAGAVGTRLAVVDALFNRQVPHGPSVARQAAASVRALLRNPSGGEVHAHLQEVLDLLGRQAADEPAGRLELEDLEQRSSRLERTAESRLRDTAGVFVHTYPHYWRHPYDPGTERRLLKVGKTDSNAYARLRAQAKMTGAPEEPLLLRVYVSASPTLSEQTFHRLLDAAEHARSTGRGAGRDWFSTTPEFLDEIAAALGLEILSVDA